MRKAQLQRTTKETDISLRLNLDGKGKAKISTGIRFFDHMLEQIARHGGLDLELRAKGDLDVDQHHTVEDVGIALGEAVKQALGNKRGILRSGYFLMPMDDCLAAAALDFSGRAYCVCDWKFSAPKVGELPNRAARGFLSRLRPVRRRERPSQADVRPLVASPGRVHLQSVRQSAALRRLPRQAPAQRSAIHQGPAMKVAIVDYGAGNLPSVERALQKLGAETERAVRPEQIACAQSRGSSRRRTLLRFRRGAPRAQSHRVAANGPRFRRSYPWHLPWPAGHVRIKRRSPRRPRPRLFRRTGRACCRKT